MKDVPQPSTLVIPQSTQVIPSLVSALTFNPQMEERAAINLKIDLDEHISEDSKVIPAQMFDEELKLNTPSRHLDLSLESSDDRPSFVILPPPVLSFMPPNQNHSLPSPMS